jgi:phosphonate metabolism protein PhnN/1,5-bisphosphokinase (PRPP-forming)
MLAAPHDLFMTARYALYLAPAPGSAWARFGADWLARGDDFLAQPRRYGFHATLKPPFRLAPGASLAALAADLERFCAARRAFVLPKLRAKRIADFLALVPEATDTRLERLAADCVVHFERYRAPLDPLEFIRRRRTPLTARQDALLERWGYPYVLDEFRCHFSFTGPLRGPLHAAPPELPPLPEESLPVDAVSLFEEPSPGADFRLVHRALLAARGRLIYLAGPSGAGKDSLLAWLRARPLPGVLLAQRTITRPATPRGEQHASVTPAQFDRMLERGEFAMHWRSNGHSYGIGREILQALERGSTVVVNGSREYLPRARALIPALEFVRVTAPAEVLRERLVARGREAPVEVNARLARDPGSSAPAVEIVNDGPLERAGEALLACIQSPTATQTMTRTVTNPA